MMKTDRLHPYSSIKSFEDFKIEKERLVMKRRIIETKLSLNFVIVKQSFSIGNMFFKVAKDYFLPNLSGILDKFLRKE